MKPNIGAGDSGETKILGCNLNKASPLIGLIGSLDELNSFIGMARSFVNFKDLDEILKDIQSDIFLIGSELGGAKLDKKVDENSVKKLESYIVKLEAEIEELKNFIYYSGSKSSTILQVCRAVCRRVERDAHIISKDFMIRKEVLSYLNRLSDLLFTIARVLNKREGFREEIWKI
ncbi:MAG: cob(I)yrinic acid a,c-diamide adenosyltransferase [Candidatus Aenigmatarchaeota archaeon]